MLKGIGPPDDEAPEMDAPGQRTVPALGEQDEIRLSDVIAALSHALDLVEGQPMGHSVRSCLIGMRLAEELHLDESQRSALFYGLLLKDAGCSSNAAKVSALFRADDRAVKRDFKTADWSRPLGAAGHVARMARPDAGPLGRARQMIAVAREADAREIVEIRCERGADIALMLGLSTDTARAIKSLDEHWDGSGHPAGLAGEDIPLLARVLGLAQTAEVFHRTYGEDSAHEVADRRAGRWFDPSLVQALHSIRSDRDFWSGLEENAWAGLAAVEPPDRALMVDASALDRVALGFAKVIDAKSPYTYRHSEGVADIAGGMGAVLDLSADGLRELRRAALLHDIGKLGVSNLILDKRGPLVDEEWAAMRRHTEHTKVILERVPRFRKLAEVASAHHERLDGSGYHRGLRAHELSLEARILAVADVAEALSADRPYRPALAPDQVREIMSRDVGARLCPEAYAALETYLESPAQVPLPSRSASRRPAPPRSAPPSHGGAQAPLGGVGVPGVSRSQ